MHSLEHGAVWITYNPDTVSQGRRRHARHAGQRQAAPADVALRGAGQADQPAVVGPPAQGRLSVTDKRIKQFADFFTQNTGYYPELGASCVNADFVAHPLVVGDASSQAGPTDPATTPSSGAAAAPRRRAPPAG